MNVRISLDSAGRILLHESTREALHLGPGDTLELEIADEANHSAADAGHVAADQRTGVWMFRGGSPLRASVTDETLRQIREERDQQNTGTGE